MGESRDQAGEPIEQVRVLTVLTTLTNHKHFLQDQHTHKLCEYGDREPAVGGGGLPPLLPPATICVILTPHPLPPTFSSSSSSINHKQDWEMNHIATYLIL